MEIAQVRKTEFRELAKALGLETHTVILDGDEWFEQLIDGDVAYRYKVLSVERVSHDMLEKTALSEGCLPTRLSLQGRAYAQAYHKGSKVFYCLSVTSKREAAYAKQLVALYAKWVVQREAERLLVAQVPVANQEVSAQANT